MLVGVFVGMSGMIAVLMATARAVFLTAGAIVLFRRMPASAGAAGKARLILLRGMAVRTIAVFALGVRLLAAVAVLVSGGMPAANRAAAGFCLKLVFYRGSVPAADNARRMMRAAGACSGFVSHDQYPCCHLGCCRLGRYRRFMRAVCSLISALVNCF